jgi:hypothetical protein
MREGQEPGTKLSRVAQARRVGSLRSTGAELNRKYWVALTLYAGLAALAWFTLGEGKVFVSGKPVELRWIPLIILGGLALRTVLAHQAEKIRRGGDRSGSSNP